MRKLLGLLALCLTAATGTGLAALSPKYAGWGTGPVRWLMTKDEQKAWTKLETDQQAIDFIDLFWARRDPTPGTEKNEFKDEFEQRVVDSDAQFRQGTTRGAMSDRGRVYIVLGPPFGSDSRTSTDASAASFESNMSVGSSDPNDSGTHVGAATQMSARTLFQYKNWLPLGLSKEEVIFIEDLRTHEFRLDPQQANAFGAMARQIEKNIVDRKLTAVPDWALKGGLEPKRIVVAKIVPIAPAPVHSKPALDPGVARLTLLKDVTRSIEPQSGHDPFADLTSQQSFTKADDLGYAFQVCRAQLSDDVVKVTLKVTGTSADKKFSLSAPPEEMVPERIKSTANCSVVRGAIPLADFEAAAYHLDVTVDDAGKTYQLGQDFHVE